MPLEQIKKIANDLSIEIWKETGSYKYDWVIDELLERIEKEYEKETH